MRTLPDQSLTGTLLDTLHRAQTGDPEARETLLTTLHVPIRDYVAGQTHRLPDSTDVADDVAQETLIRILTRLHACRASTDRQVLAWALAVARTRLIDHMRRIQPRVERMDDVAAVPAPVEPDSSESDPAVLAGAVRKVVRGLPQETRTLLELRVEHGETWPAIAHALRTTAAGAKRRFQRAQERLRRDLQDGLEGLPVRQREALRERLRRIR
jgi:RNA polymerase sigma factor (sigma-70 family)